jgi:hypothetical protein
MRWRDPMIQLNGAGLKTQTPADPSAALLALTGCSPVEVTRMLAGFPLASFVAQALTPFLADPPSVPELAQIVEANGVADAAAKAIALISPPPAEKVAADAKS